LPLEGRPWEPWLVEADAYLIAVLAILLTAWFGAFRPAMAVVLPGVNSSIVKPLNFDSFAQAIEELGRSWLLLNQPPKPKR